MASPLTVKRNEYHKNPKRSDIPTPHPLFGAGPVDVYAINVTHNDQGKGQTPQAAVPLDPPVGREE